MIVLLAAIAFVAATFLLFAPRSCSVEGDSLKVRTRLLTLRFTLKGVTKIEPVPREALGGWKTLRLFGFGWPMRPFGWFYNSRLGTFLSLVNDPQNMCMLQMPARQLLVSPAGGIEAFARR